MFVVFRFFFIFSSLIVTMKRIPRNYKNNVFSMRVDFWTVLDVLKWIVFVVVFLRCSFSSCNYENLQ